MMRILFNGEIFEAASVEKTGVNITGYNSSNNEVFSFKGISDFSQFQLQDEDGNNIEFPSSPPAELEELSNYVLDVDFRVVMLEMGI